MRILTFDIEDWFHILDNSKSRIEKDWLKFESRIERNMDLIFKIIEKSNVNPTFFVLGWIAERHPKIIKKISDLGFEVGSHTNLHQLVYEQDRKTFKNDVEKSIKIIEDITGRKVISFRAPGFSITKKNIWAFEVLHNLGIELDSSVFPAGRAHGGFPSFTNQTPSILEYGGIKLKEFPINTHSIFGRNIIFSGGGYFRLIPYHLIKRWSKKSNYIMTYFHPRDFDHNQPLVPGLSPLRLFKSYVGLKNSKFKLEKWLSDFEFISLEKADNMINWDKAPIIKL